MKDLKADELHVTIISLMFHLESVLCRCYLKSSESLAQSLACTLHLQLVSEDQEKILEQDHDIKHHNISIVI